MIYRDIPKNIKNVATKILIISNYFTGTTLPTGWTDSTSAFTVASNLLTGTSTIATGYNTNTLTRNNAEASLNQQIIVEKMGGHSTKAYLGVFVRRQTNGDHYLVNIQPTGLLEISRVVGGIKTNIVAPITLTGYIEANPLEITVTAKSSNSTYLSVVVVDVNGYEMANVMFEESSATALTLQNAGTSGVSVWQNTLGGTFNTVDCRRIVINNLNSILNIVHIGDSQTFGFGSGTNGGIIGNNYPSQLRKKLGDYTIHKNLGVNGKRASLMLTDSVNEAPNNFVPSATSNIAVVWAGTNDLIQYGGVGVTSTEAFNLIKNLCINYKQNGYKVVVCTILSGRYATTNDNFAFNNKRKDLNEQIRNTYLDFADALADLGANSKIGMDQAENNSNYFFDSIHCNSDGYNLCSGIIENAIYSITSGAIRVSEPIENKITGVIYKQFTVSTITNTNLATTGISTGGANGLPIIRAGTLSPNDYFEIEIIGRYTTGATANPIKIDLKLGTAVLFSLSGIALPVNATNNSFKIVYNLKCNNIGVFPNATMATVMNHNFNTTPTILPGSVVFDSTIDNTFDITGQWTTATATESIQFRNILINKY
jgi:lysophospholipase L1-like esterase